MTQEALKLALEALEDALNKPMWNRPKMTTAITAIKEALAQTQEPVPPPWWPAVENILTEYGLQAIDFVADFKQALAQTQEPVCNKDPKSCWFVRCQLGKKCKHTPPQRTWVGLTDEQIDTIGDKVANEKLFGAVPNFRVRFAKAIEAKLKQKNGYAEEKNT